MGPAIDPWSCVFIDSFTKLYQLNASKNMGGMCGIFFKLAKQKIQQFFQLYRYVYFSFIKLQML